jgi:hypothetical protein
VRRLLLTGTFLVALGPASAEIRSPIGPESTSQKEAIRREQIQYQRRGFYHMDCKSACNRTSVEEGDRNIGLRYFIRYNRERLYRLLPKPYGEEVPLFPHPVRDILVEELNESRERAEAFYSECYELLCHDMSYRNMIPEVGFSNDRLKDAMKRARDLKAREEAERARRDDELKQQRLRENAERIKKDAEKVVKGQDRIDRNDRLAKLERGQRESERAEERNRVDEWNEMRNMRGIPLEAGGGSDDSNVRVGGLN